MSDDYKHLDQFSNHKYIHPLIRKAVEDIFKNVKDISISRILKTRSQEMEFQWVNRGRKIGIKYSDFINREKLRKVRVTLESINIDLKKNWKKIEEYRAKNPYNSPPMKLSLRQTKLLKIIKELRQKEAILKDNFYQIATIPEDIYQDKLKRGDKRVTITVLIGDVYYEGVISKRVDAGILSKQLVEALKKKFSYHFPLHIVFLEENNIQKPACKILNVASIPNEKGINIGGRLLRRNIFEGAVPEIVLKEDVEFSAKLGIALHEFVHLFGFINHPWEDSYASTKFTKDQINIAKVSNLFFKLGLADYFNDAYFSYFRMIYNKSFRSFSRALLEKEYGSTPSHSKDVIFRFKPEENKQDYHLKTYKEDDYTVEEFSGNISGLTVHNNSTASLFDFNYVPKFKVLPQRSAFGDYAQGVTTILLDSGDSVIFKITFETYQPLKVKINGQAFDLSRDHNVDTSLSTKYIKEIFYSPHSDKGYFESKREITIHPGKGDDEFTFAKGKKFIVKTNADEGMDILIFEEGTAGTIHLGYPLKNLEVEFRGKGGDLLYFAEKKTPKGIERHGVRIPNYMALKTEGKLFLDIKDSSGGSLIR